MAKVQIQELASTLMDKASLSRTESEKLVTEMFNLIEEGLLRDGIVKIKGFGTFKIVDVEARESVNVNTGVRQLIEGHNKISFTPDSTMKELVNKPFSLFDTVILNEGVSFDDEAMLQNALAEVAPLLSEPISEDKTGEAEQAAAEEPEEISEDEKEIMEETVEESEPVEDEPELVDEEPEQTNEEPEPVENEPEPVDEEPEQVEEESEHVEQETEPAEEEPEPVEDELEETEIVDEDDENEGRWTWLKWACGILLLLLVAGGLYYYRNQWLPESVQSPASVAKQKGQDKQVAPADSLKEEVLDSAAAAKLQEAKEAEMAKAEHDRIVKDAETYEAIDIRLKTGAYYITGFDYETKAKPGENIRKIANRSFGKGMECYICAYNNMSGDTKPLQPGQKIKIPKLVLKSKVRKMVE